MSSMALAFAIPLALVLVLARALALALVSCFAFASFLAAPGPEDSSETVPKNIPSLLGAVGRQMGESIQEGLRLPIWAPGGGQLSKKTD